MSNVLVLTLVFLPDGVSTATLVSELTRELHLKGHKLSIITTVPHYNVEPESRRAQPLTRRLGGLFYRSEYHGIPVWHTVVARKGQGAGGRMLGYMLFNGLSLILGLFAVEHPDVILVVSPPLTSGVVGWILARLKRAQLVYNVQEMYPDTFIQTKTLRTDSFTAKVLFWIEHFVYQRATALTVICGAFQRAVVAKGTSAQKISIIPNFVNTDEITPGSKANPLAEELGLANKYVVLYAGNIGMTQSFDALLESAQNLQAEPDIRFLVVGDGVRRTYVAEQIQKLGLKNVTLLPYQPRSRVSDIYATADMGLVPLMAGTAQTTLPSKLYSIMASGRPVLAAVDADSDIVETVESAKCGVVIPPDDAVALSDAIRQGFNQQDAFRLLGKNGRAYMETRFSRQTIASQYNQLIEKLVDMKKS